MEDKLKPQRQDSLTDQMETVLMLARDNGCYDAQDWIKRNFTRPQEPSGDVSVERIKKHVIFDFLHIVLWHYRNGCCNEKEWEHNREKLSAVEKIVEEDKDKIAHAIHALLPKRLDRDEVLRQMDDGRFPKDNRHKAYKSWLFSILGGGE